MKTVITALTALALLSPVAALAHGGSGPVGGKHYLRHNAKWSAAHPGLKVHYCYEKRAEAEVPFRMGAACPSN